VLVDEQLVVSAVNRAVQHGLVQADLDVLELVQRSVERKGITNHRGHGIVNAFPLAPFGGLRVLRISERNPDRYAGAGLVGEQTNDLLSSVRNEAL
jgi:hypothetical protein